MKKFNFFLYLAALTLFFAAAGSSYAAEFIKPTSQDPNVTVSSSETHKNLYVGGVNVTINGNTQGDLVAGGGMVTVIGDVQQEAIIGGGTVFLNGKVGGHARVAGGNVTIVGPVGGDLILAGGNVTITEKSAIGGDLVAGAGNLVLDAPVKGNVRLAGGSLEINSKIGGNVNVFISRKNNSGQGGLVFGPQAEVLGKIVYTGPSPAVVKDGAKVGAIDYSPLTLKGGFGRMLGALLTVGFLIKLLAWIIAGLVLARFKKDWLQKVFESLHAKPFANLGWGLVGLIVIPIIALVLFITVVGYYLAFIVGISYVLMLVVVNLMAALMAGNLVMTYLTKSRLNGFNWQAVVIGVVLYVLVGFIPFLGWLAVFLLFLFTLGAVLSTMKSHWGAGA